MAQPQDAWQAYWNAWNTGKFSEAVAHRDVLRRQLAKMPVDDPQFGTSATNLAQIYQNTGRTVQSRVILQDALSRASKLAESDPARIQLLMSLASAWEVDGNLLEAISCWRRVKTASQKESNLTGIRLVRFPRGFETMRLAELLRRAGKPEEASAVITELLAHAEQKDRFMLRAQYYEQSGELDQAAAMYRHQADQGASDPQAPTALQLLANVYERQQRYADAVDAMKEAVALVQQSQGPDNSNQAFWMRQNLASTLAQAGQVEASDQLFEQLLTEAPKDQSWQYTQVLMGYANSMIQSNRAEAAGKMLDAYLERSPNLQPNEEAMLLFTRSNVESQLGHSEQAQAYQRSAQEKQQALIQADTSDGRTLLAPRLMEMTQATNTGNPDEALAIALRALAAAPHAADRDQVVALVANTASSIAAAKPDEAQRLYLQVLVLTESWRTETMQPLLNALQCYANFVMQSPRWPETPAVLDRYREAVIDAHGVNTNALGDVLRLKLEYERSHDQPRNALTTAQDLLAQEESLSGDTSEPYLRALQSVAETYQQVGDSVRALALRSQAMAIADLVFSTHDLQRAQVRIDAGLLLAQQGQFDEAERLGQEAVAIAYQSEPPQPEAFTAQLQQIRQMKLTSAQRR